MLVLTRKENQSIWINDEIRIVISRTQLGSVRIGIDAPRCYDIERGEVRKRRLANPKERKELDCAS